MGYTLPEETLIGLLIRASFRHECQAVLEYIVGSRASYLFRHQLDYKPERPGGAKFIQMKPQFLTEKRRDVYTLGCEGVRWLCEQYPSTDVRVAEIVKSREQKLLDLFKWLQARGLGSWSTQVMDKAASRGFLRVVQWFHANRQEGCTKAAMDNTAANGHLHVVQWLHANIAERCTAHAHADPSGGKQPPPRRPVAACEFERGIDDEGNASCSYGRTSACCGVALQTPCRANGCGPAQWVCRLHLAQSVQVSVRGQQQRSLQTHP